MDIVVLGASAGGVQVLRKTVAALPAQFDDSLRYRIEPAAAAAEQGEPPRSR